jgi:hypothetical protein
LIALGALHHLVGDAAALLQGAKPVHLHGGEMREHISTTVVGLDEAEALGVVEPLDHAERHVCAP